VALHTSHVWRFLNTHQENAFFNMALDEVLVRSVEKGAPPVFRVYGWHPPAVSFGYAQRIAREIDAEKCRAEGIHIVRRATGGRAVLHWNELTYSVACLADDPAMGGNIQEAYRRISAGLLSGLVRLGVQASFEPRRREQPAPRGKVLTSPCFTSTAQYEIALEGRKLIGSAQRRMGAVLLQHGSLLLGPEHKHIVDFLPDGAEALKERFRRELDRQTLSLSEALGRPIAFVEAATALRAGLGDAFDIALIDADLSLEERADAEALMAEKYATDEWNYRH